MRRALVVGVSGQDGSYLAQLLLSKGYEVVGTSRDAQMAQFGGLTELGIRSKVTLESMSPTDPRGVLNILSKWSPDEIYNMAGQSSVSLSFERPLDAINSLLNSTVTLMEAIRALKKSIRFFSAGSSECFGDVTSGMASESTPFRPRSPYAVAKAAAHRMVANYREGYGMYACTGILFNHESPLRPQTFVTRKITVAAAQIALGKDEKLSLGNIGVQRDWGWAPEYVDAMWRMLQRPEPRDYVIATGRLSSLQDFIEAAFQEVGLDWRDHVSVDCTLIRPIDLQGFAGDASQARSELDWWPRIKMPEVARAMMAAELRSAKSALT